MVTATGPILFNELHRLEALRSYRILDTPKEPTFDALTRLAAKHFDVPIALISLVDTNRQWFKASSGLEAEETAREVSFCAHAIVERGVMQVSNANEDPRFARNKLVTGEPGIVFYAGAPLVTEEGFALGTLCIIDRKPRDLLDEEGKTSLKDLASLVMRELELHKLRSRVDRVKAAGLADLLSPPEAELVREARLGVLAALAHEMRTPLNAVLGFGEAMKHELFGPLGNLKYADYADCICRSGSHLLELVNNILDFARLEHGDLHPQESTFDLATLVDECLHLFIEESRRREVKVEPRLLSQGTVLKADRRLIGQVLLNLIGNGLKFTHAGGSVSVLESRQPDGRLVIEITDTGVGMSKTQINSALRPFGRLPHSGAEQGQGSGLGLPLSKRLIELHGGELKIRSKPGRGTTVVLGFPAHIVGPADWLAQEA